MNTNFDQLKEIGIDNLLPILIPYFIVTLLLVLISLFDIYKRKNILKFPWFWMIIVIIFNLIGSIIYLLLGRNWTENDNNR
ncbi:PLDc N-terminal domain-containing protein [Staphylococcus caprae]|uniref:PLDc N-terminal domain-containing protein n=1 Tax=Staphylococcus caprae TaxID=29380 RepID=UPI003B218BCC